mmetsp:Transcript_15236/g.45992  ORF Transcript_15236/g.45992 Transcript_15236/m.45992 type:complete len:250 (+) Transcript_15236:2550-3299(+)
MRVHLTGIELVEVGGQDAQPLLWVVIPVEPNACVAGVIVPRVEILELLKCKVWNDGRVATAVNCITVGREKRLLRDGAIHAVRLAVHALHLVEHHALVDERVLGLLKLQVPTLLRKGLRVPHAVGEEYCVHVYVHQVVKVLQVAGSYGVAGAVRVCESIEESVERPLHELHKWLLDRVFLTAAENGVFQNVGDTLAILHRCPQHHPKAFVLVTVHQRHDLAPCLLVLVGEDLGVILSHELIAHKLETCY